VRVLWGKALLFAGILVTACSPKPEKIPVSVIQPEKFTSLMIQLHIAEASVTSLNLPPDSANALFRKAKKETLIRKKVDEKEFEKAFRYYSEHPVEMDKIYAAVVDSLSLRESLLPKVN